MRITVRFYGPLAALIDENAALDVAEPLITVGELRSRLADTYPAAGDVIATQRTKCFVGDRMVSDGHMIDDGETVEFLPPVSGG